MKSPPRMGRRLLCIAGVIMAAITPPGDELALREWDTAEHFAGIFAAARRITAFLGGNAVVQNRHHQLGIPLQADNGKLPQCHQQIPGCTACDQLFVEDTADGGRDLCHGAVPTVFLKFGTEYHRIQDFHHPHQFARWKSGDCHFFKFLQHHTDTAIFIDGNMVKDTAHIHIGNCF